MCIRDRSLSLDYKIHTFDTVSYTHLRAHETVLDLVCRLLLEKNLNRATKIAEETNGGILVISEGVFGMRGEQGKLKEIVELKKKFKFRLLVDDAHGFGTLGKTGAGAGEEQGVQDEIDVYFATFAKSLASTGAFIASDRDLSLIHI